MSKVKQDNKERAQRGLAPVFKKKRDLKNAKAQLAIEKKSWQKSQELVLKAAAAHPLPSPKVAKAAVQAKVATEAARAMKELENREKDPAEKALDEKNVENALLRLELDQLKAILGNVAQMVAKV